MNLIPHLRKKETFLTSLYPKRQFIQTLHLHRRLQSRRIRRKALAIAAAFQIGQPFCIRIGIHLQTLALPRLRIIKQIDALPLEFLRLCGDDATVIELKLHVARHQKPIDDIATVFEFLRLAAIQIGSLGILHITERLGGRKEVHPSPVMPLFAVHIPKFAVHSLRFQLLHVRLCLR